MSNIYDTIVFALREHWKNHGGDSPQSFEISTQSFSELKKARQEVLLSLKCELPSGWEENFQGVQIAVVDGGNFMVDKDGNRVPLNT